MKAVLGSFATKRARERCGGDLASFLDAAVGFYEHRLRSGVELPAPPPELAEALDPPLVEAEVDLTPARAAALEAESRRLGLDPQLLVNHAVLLYLADLDRRERQPQCSGRKRRGSTLAG